MQPSDKVLVIKSFIDRNGNIYQSRTEPYQYGELPSYIRDNEQFVIPLETVELTTSIITKDSYEDLTPNSDVLKFKPKQILTEYIKKEIAVPVVEEKPIAEEIIQTEEPIINIVEETKTTVRGKKK